MRLVIWQRGDRLGGSGGVGGGERFPRAQLGRDVARVGKCRRLERGSACRRHRHRVASAIERSLEELGEALDLYVARAVGVERAT